MSEREVEIRENDSRVSARVTAAADAFLQRRIEEQRFPSASYAVGTSRRLLAHNALGLAVVEPRVIRATTETIYDLASVTKPLLTASLALLLHQTGLLNLHDRVALYLPELREDKHHITLLDLLTHRSGLPWWYPFYAIGSDAASYFAGVNALDLVYETGTEVIYSDPGYVLIMLTLQRVLGRPVPEVVHELLFEPLGLRRTMLAPRPEWRESIAATDRGNATERGMVEDLKIPFDRFREAIIWGEVNDGNAWGIGGYSGTAGLFGTALDALALARLYTPGSLLLSEATRSLALRDYTAGLNERRAIGWQLRSGGESDPGEPLSEGSFGHSGFTGTSVWIDPSRDLLIVLLTNRIHPEIRERKMQRLRREFHEVIVAAL